MAEPGVAGGHRGRQPWAASCRAARGRCPLARQPPGSGAVLAPGWQGRREVRCQACESSVRTGQSVPGEGMRPTVSLASVWTGRSRTPACTPPAVTRARVSGWSVRFGERWGRGWCGHHPRVGVRPRRVACVRRERASPQAALCEVGARGWDPRPRERDQPAGPRLGRRGEARLGRLGSQRRAQPSPPGGSRAQGLALTCLSHRLVSMIWFTSSWRGDRSGRVKGEGEAAPGRRFPSPARHGHARSPTLTTFTS